MVLYAILAEPSDKEIHPCALELYKAEDSQGYEIQLPKKAKIKIKKYHQFIIDNHSSPISQTLPLPNPNPSNVTNIKNFKQTFC